MGESGNLPPVAPPGASVGACANCAAAITPRDRFCARCGAPVAPTAAPPPQPQRLDPGLSHRFERALSVPLAVAAAVFTANAFFVFNYARKHGLLPKSRRGDPSAGAALGLLFVPLFNLFWACFVWIRLAQRIDGQYVLRGKPGPIGRLAPVLVSATFVATVLGAFADAQLGASLWLVNWLVFVPMLTAQYQSAINGLVEAG